jgi:hypothetical protein
MFIKCLVWYGITFSICSAKLLQKPRQYLMENSGFLAELLGCPFCVGFHVGWLLHVYQDRVITVDSLITNSFSAATFCYTLDVLLRFLEKHIES